MTYDSSHSAAPESALVMGGGIAGIAAAMRLAEQGVRVTLIETRKRLGGRATSHVDPQTGEKIDNCQHVLMGCCTSLIDLYRRLDVADRIDWHTDLHFFDKSGGHDILNRDDLPAPLHLTRTMMLMETLSWREKIAIARAVRAIIRLGKDGRDQLESRSFGDWLREHGQPAGAIEKYWNVVIISALNQTADRASAKYALQVFQDGFLCHRDAYVMGIPAVPLVELYDAAESFITARGGTVRLGSSVEQIDFHHDQITGVRVSGSPDPLTAEVYVNALPFDRLAKVSPEEMLSRDSRLAGLGAFEVSPIIGIHLWYDRPVLRWPHMIFMDSPLQWLFSHGAESDGSQHLHGVISAAHEWVDLPAAQIVAMVQEEFAMYEPAARDVEPRRTQVIKEKRATFSPSPGTDTIRPAAAPKPGDTANLYLAGDWTETGWPATMEGATRSGYLAASAILNLDCTIADLQSSDLYQLIQRIG